ncbi:hypothetical protein LTR60_004792 [Cryomyces antarcticus]|nr:hypothetical protein LTR60_004792 [Cryomyces antarcticus]
MGPHAQAPQQRSDLHDDAVIADDDLPAKHTWYIIYVGVGFASASGGAAGVDARGELS